MAIGHWRLGLLLCCIGFAAAAQPADEFWRGKRLTIYYGADPGSSYDIEARMIGRYVARHLPGNPTPVVVSMPAAGGIAALNYMAVNAPKDGTEIAIVNRGNVTLPLLGFAEAKFDPQRFGWIGSRSGDATLAIVWHTVPVHSLDDLRQRKLIFGSAGGGTDTNTLPRIFNSTLGTHIDIVSGYTGGTGLTLALERGEIEGRIWSYGAILTSQPDWYRDKKVVPLLQLAIDKRPALADVPMAQDIAGNARDAAIQRFFAARSELGLPMLAPPGLPPERLAALRQAFDLAMADPDYRAEAVKAQIDVDPRSGARLDALIDLIYQTPAELLDEAKNMLLKQGVQLQ